MKTGTRAKRKFWRKTPLILLAVVLCASFALNRLRPDIWQHYVSAVSGFWNETVAAGKSSSSEKPSSLDSSAPEASSPGAESTVSSPESSEPEAVTVSLEQAVRPLSISVSLSDQRVVVSDAQERIVKDFVCSTGEEGSETPTGTFTVTDRGKSFYNPEVSQGAYYWTRFYKTFLFHSVPFDEKEELIPQEAAKLGQPASHGCIRLEIEDAEWIYNNIPEGTAVTIE